VHQGPQVRRNGAALAGSLMLQVPPQTLPSGSALGHWVRTVPFNIHKALGHHFRLAGVPRCSRG
jgi:hypothetical protein